MSIPKPISKGFVGSNCAAPPPIKIVTAVPATVTTSPFSVQWYSVPMGTWSVGAGGGGTSAPENKINKDGCTCKKCKEYYQYAEPNQDDGTLICYGCRMHW